MKSREAKAKLLHATHIMTYSNNDSLNLCKNSWIILAEITLPYHNNLLARGLLPLDLPLNYPNLT